MARRRSLPLALGVNAALLAALLLHAAWPTPAAHAQPEDGFDSASAPSVASSFRAPGRYRAVSGELTAGSTDAIWILDEVNEELLALRWDQSRRQLEPLGYRDLRTDTTLRPTR